MTARTGRKTSVGASILRGLRQAKQHAGAQARKFWRIVEVRSTGFWSPGLKSEVSLLQCVKQASRLQSPLVVVRRGRAIALLYALKGSRGQDIAGTLASTQSKKKTKQVKA